jgi:hypothetical protein
LLIKDRNIIRIKHSKGENSVEVLNSIRISNKLKSKILALPKEKE